MRALQMRGSRGLEGLAETCKSERLISITVLRLLQFWSTASGFCCLSSFLRRQRRDFLFQQTGSGSTSWELHGFPYQTPDLMKYKLTICRLTQCWKAFPNSCLMFRLQLHLCMIINLSARIWIQILSYSSSLLCCLLSKVATPVRRRPSQWED